MPDGSVPAAGQDSLPVVESCSRIIRPGETVSALLSDYLAPRQIVALSQACDSSFPLSRIRAGRIFSLQVADGELVGFDYEINAEEKLAVSCQAAGFTVSRVPIAYDVNTVVVQGTIDSTLFAAVTAIGEKAELAYKLADIFAWEVDFIRDIRAGDRFRALVQKRYRDGKFIDYGLVQAAEFTNQGKNFLGILYRDEDGLPGYYNADGSNLRKAFLKAPLSFHRISSTYSHRRLHPIRKIWLPHPGIDYAAPVGTPVKAAGNGTVVCVASDNQAGNYVKIRHPNGYESSYLHLSRFAGKAKRGIKVAQGEVIGYVGSTGMATGPHLDFRMKKNGRFINPLKMENPRARRLSDHVMPSFLQKMFACQASLETIRLVRHDFPEGGETQL